METRAQSGYRALIGTTDDRRVHRIAAHLSAAYARRPFDAQAGIGDQTPNEVIATEGLKESYFQDQGRRAGDLDVESMSIDHRRRY